MTVSNITNAIPGIINWFSQPGIPQIIILVILGILVLRFIFGGHSSSSSNTTVVPPGDSVASKGFPTKMYTGSQKLSDFSIKPEVYDFRVPSPKLDASNLKKSANLNLGLASKLFVANTPKESPVPLNVSKASKLFFGEIKNPGVLDMNKASELFIPHLKDGEEIGKEEQDG